MKKLSVLLLVVLICSGCQLPQSVTIDFGASPTPGAALPPATEPPGEVTLPSATIDVASIVDATLTALASPMPAIPTGTNTPLPTVTTGAPMVSVTTATNCRVGPGQVYDRVGALLPGEIVEIIARDPTGNYWFVRDTESPTGFCWVWAFYATPVGNYAAVPVFTPQPTPTPAPGFIVSYTGVTTCAGMFAFNFQVSNNGSVTWDSIRIFLTDNTNATSTTHQYDGFRSYNACLLDVEQDDLAPGEGGPVTTVNPGQINYNPAGHSFTAQITICSAEGLGGTCKQQTINFTP